MRQVVLDTETTGLEVSQGHKIIEIGCVELINRRLTGRHYHQYINPGRDIDQGAIEVHGITNDFLNDKPTFDLVAQEFIDFIDGAELVIHNAPFDVGFLNYELSEYKASLGKIADYSSVVDTLVMARQKHPGQRNSLDALCQRYYVDNSQRELHGALLDAEILADVYLLMTGGQTNLLLNADGAEEGGSNQVSALRRLEADRPALKVIPAAADELDSHQLRLQAIDKASDSNCLWLKNS